MQNLVFRAIRPGSAAKKLQRYHPTMRPPGNIPYVVDNLWEWKRPAEYPNRRYSAFASPSRELAVSSAGKNSLAYRVEIIGNYKLCQLQKNLKFKNNEDSKNHPDCSNLRKLLFNKIGQEWINISMQEKGAAGKLWIPCLTKKEIEDLFETVAALRVIRDDVYNAISYWNDVALIKNGDLLPDKQGEVFFQALDGYYLHSMNDCN